MRAADFRNSSRNYQGAFIVWILLFTLIGCTSAPCLGQTEPDAIQADRTAFLCSLQDAFSEIAERAEPGIVSITAVQATDMGSVQSGHADPGGLDDMLKRFFGNGHTPTLNGLPFPGLQDDDDESSIVTASGSGVIVRRAGDVFYVLTNYHVVEDAYRVTVRLFDGTPVRGTVLGIDSVTDLAVVGVSSPRLSDRNIVPMGDSGSVKVGSWALAVGSPFGFDHSLTVGVVSALHRQLEEDGTSYPDLIQTDASINKGNSGGPLLNIEGEVVGINSAIASPTGGFIGLGFAIPIDAAKAVLDDLITDGRVIRGWIGVGIQELTPALAEYFGARQGVVVASVDKRGPAAQAGLAEEDVITKVDATSISDVLQLQRLVAGTNPGRSALLSVVRKKKEQTLKVTVGLSPMTPAGRPSPPRVQGGDRIQVRTLPGELAERIGLKGVKGVVVISVMPGTPADEAGLEDGDVIVSLNGRAVGSELEFARSMQDIRSRGLVVLKVMRRSEPRMIGFHTE